MLGCTICFKTCSKILHAHQGPHLMGMRAFACTAPDLRCANLRIEISYTFSILITCKSSCCTWASYVEMSPLLLTTTIYLKQFWLERIRNLILSMHFNKIIQTHKFITNWEKTTNLIFDKYIYIYIFAEEKILSYHKN